MSGKLSEELEVSGVISDQKLPFQPDGNTASLDEIDQIFINATHSKWRSNSWRYKHIFEKGQVQYI